MRLTIGNLFRSLIIPTMLWFNAIEACPGGLLVYEPFDYKPHDDEVHGALQGRAGGLGFAGPWSDIGGDSFIYDKRGNPESLYAGRWGEGKPDWDGVVDNLPTMGGYVGASDWRSGHGLNATRKLARSAGEMAKENGGVLWLSAVWHLPSQSYFAPVGIALASNDSGFKDRAIAMDGKADAIGVGNGRKFREGRKRLNPVIWKQGEEVAGTNGTLIDNSKDNIIILKYEFGETDKVSTWYFTEDQEMSEAAFDQHAISSIASIDEDTLNVLSVCTILRDNAIDEIRIGTSFQSVISGSIPARQEVKITKRNYDAKRDSYTLEWASNPGEVYGLYLAEDAGGYQPCINALVAAANDGNVTTFGPFANPHTGDSSLQFAIGLPDTKPPTIDRVWGGSTAISLMFSEPMLPSTSLTAESYTVLSEDGQKVAVKSAAFNPDNGTVTLTTAAPLKPATSYAVQTRGLTDLANYPLVEDQITLRTWDNDPNGIKVFIMAGQSNMVGYGHSETGQGGPASAGTLRYLALQDAKYPEYDYRSLLMDSGKPDISDWKTRSDVKVWWRNGARAQLGGPIGKGDLGPPFRGANENWFGPEYGFGQVIGDHYSSDDVLIIKASWGGHKLVSNFRPPSAVAKRGGEIGASYQAIFNDAHEVLDNLDAVFPEWSGRGYEIVGFAWHQGFSDKGQKVVSSEYKHNLPDLIRDVRSEFGKPDLPFVIATTGMNNAGPTKPYPFEGYHPVERAQLWVAGIDKPANVLTDDTRGYWEEAEVSPRNQGFHWHGNARTYFRIGLGLGKNMVKLLTP